MSWYLTTDSTSTAQASFYYNISGGSIKRFYYDNATKTWVPWVPKPKYDETWI